MSCDGLGYCERDGLLEEVRRLQGDIDARKTVDEAIDKVLEGFDRNVFVRSVERDHEPGWAVTLFPYLRALGLLAALRSEATKSAPEPPRPEPGAGEETHDG